jgi:hypothetical protein
MVEGSRWGGGGLRRSLHLNVQSMYMALALLRRGGHEIG